MKINFAIALLISGLLITSCKDDDNGPPSPRPNNTILFQSIAEDNFLMWVSGQSVNTSNLNIVDFIDDSYPINEANFTGISYEFSNDSLFAKNDTLTESYPYYFTGDSLYVLIEFFGNDSFPVFFGTGTRNEIKAKQSIIRYYQTSGNLSQTGESNVQGHHTFASSQQHHAWQNLSDMTEGDSLIIYNYTILFN